MQRLPSGEVVITPRNFKLLEELDKAEKGHGCGLWLWFRDSHASSKISSALTPRTGPRSDDGRNGTNERTKRADRARPAVLRAPDLHPGELPEGPPAGQVRFEDQRLVRRPEQRRDRVLEGPRDEELDKESRHRAGSGVAEGGDG
ncbi:hypothetical protein THAOC_08217 [Thalassiosira oceanica]|uniref:Uncharacterized protein n=1 Tax=Thalassiosira oceanica TaxID=159749 RepID=K0SVI2_THAOC|nr:hypothetical protein THAOC_08217 [Thalassiosira oceanica]|eukprot:EJK70428.1 hypothetical protein THAOC_08217 [Thalassiosira oceanica]